MSVSLDKTVVHEWVSLACDSLVLAEGDSNAASPPTLSSLTVEPHDLWPRPGHGENTIMKALLTQT